MPRRRAKRTRADERSLRTLGRALGGEPDRNERGSAQHGVARLQKAAGNDAVQGMLHRFHDAEEMEAPERFTAGEAANVQTPEEGEAAQEGEAGLGIGARIVEGIRDAAEQAGVEPGQLPAPERIEEQVERDGDQEEILRGVASQLGVRPAAATGGGSARAQELRSLTLSRLRGADGPTRELAGSLADVVGDAWAAWQLSATMINVLVNAVSAAGGTVVAPPLAGLIRAQGGAADTAAGQALADAIGPAFDLFAASIHFTGQPVFPSFAAVPAPVAAPVPSMPTPLATLNIVPPIVGRQFESLNPTQRRACEAVVGGFGNSFSIWSMTTMVSVLGTGPVPTFAPPYVPVGPVVGGIATGVPGAFLQ